MTTNAHPPNHQISPNFINQLKRLPCQPSESVSSLGESMTVSQEEGERAILQFRREIQARFQISIANKIYSFPRRYCSVSDVVSSDESEGEKDDPQSQEMIQYLKPKLQKQEYRFLDHDEDITNNPFKKKIDTSKANYKKSSPNTKNQPRKKSKNSTKNSERKKEAYFQKHDKFQKETNLSKRLNTEPNPMNYIQTIKLKMQKKL